MLELASAAGVACFGAASRGRAGAGASRGAATGCDSAVGVAMIGAALESGIDCCKAAGCCASTETGRTA